MKYIIMCGGDYHTETPKQLREYGTGITIVERTIRFLQIAGVDDIAISTNDDRFEWLGLPILRHDNDFEYGHEERHRWLKAFYPMTEPCCYIFGDVFFSPQAIKTIVDTETDSVEFFASAPPFSKDYFKEWAEPFAFKVQDTEFFFKKVEECHQYDLEGRFHREAVSWELWQVIKDTPLDVIDYTNYTAINDYTTDFDSEDEYREFKRRMGRDV